MADFSYIERTTGTGSNSNNSESEENTGNIVNITDTADDGSLEPIDNKWNDLHGMFTTDDVEMRMNDDTPSVEIYISHEKVWKTNDDGEVDLESAVMLNDRMNERYDEIRETAKKNNMEILREKGKTVQAMNAIDKLDLSKTPEYMNK